MNTSLTRQSPLLKAAVWMGYFLMKTPEHVYLSPYASGSVTFIALVIPICVGSTLLLVQQAVAVTCKPPCRKATARRRYLGVTGMSSRWCSPGIAAMTVFLYDLQHAYCIYMLRACLYMQHACCAYVRVCAYKNTCVLSMHDFGIYAINQSSHH